MDRVFQRIWDRYGARYSWALCVVMYPIALMAYLTVSMFIVAFERSDRYLEAAVIAMVVVLLRVYLLVLPHSDPMRLIGRWAAGHEVDRMKVLDASYTFARRMVARTVAMDAVWGAALAVVVAAIAGATGWRLVQYGIFGVVYGAGLQLVGVHSFAEGALRPARAAIGGDTGVGDLLPRSRPTFAAWANMSLLAVVFTTAVGAVLWTTVIDRFSQGPLVWIVIGCGCALLTGPIIAFLVFSPFLRPIRDLAEGTERVAAGLWATPPGGTGR